MPLSERVVSILVPVYNEEEYLPAALDGVLRAPLPEGCSREIIVVDDGSTDGSAEAAEAIARSCPGIRVFRHAANRGKGAAIRTALERATGEYTIIQDADLEYDPSEYPKLIGPLLEGRADAVFGSRFLVSAERRVLYYWHSLANHLLTTAANMLADLNLTDMETCYKAARTSLLQSIPLRQERFGFEPEITVKLAKRQARIYEVPVSYHGRTYEEGKKIGFRDALETVWVLFATWLSNDIYKDPGQSILDAFAGAHRFNRWMADTVRPYLGAEVLEIGAGMGNLSRHLAPRRKRYIASDIDDEHLARLRVRLRHRPNLEVRQCDLENPADFAPLDGQLDSVVCLNVLEHIADEQTGLRNMHRVLRPGGTAVVLVPQGPHLMGSLDEALGHQRRHTEESLRRAMQEAGFVVRETVKFNRIALPGWWWNGKILKRRTIGRCQLGIYDRLVWLWRRVDHYLPWEPASIIGVGVKH